MLVADGGPAVWVANLPVCSGSIPICANFEANILGFPAGGYPYGPECSAVALVVLLEDYKNVKKQHVLGAGGHVRTEAGTSESHL